MTTRLPLSMVALVALGCGRADGGGDALSVAEQATLDRGNDANVASQNALELVDRLFQLDATKSAAQNAMAIQTQASTELGTCGTVALNGTTVEISFGSPPGCTLKGGTLASGSLVLMVTASAGTITVAATFTSLVVNGKPLDGSLSISTLNGTTLIVVGSLSSDGKASELDLKAARTTSSMTISGSLTAMESGAAATALTFTQVVLVKRDCYPSSGSLKYAKGAVSETLTFLSTTPKDGKATLRIGVKTTTVTLPAYGKCPPPSDGG